MTDDEEQPIIKRIASTIVASPHWHPCKRCGNPIVFKAKAPYDVVSKDPHTCKNTRKEWNEHLRDVNV